MAPDFEGFARAVLQEWPTSDIDGADLFDMALQYGMIFAVPGGFDPEVHDDDQSVSPAAGDPWYEYNFEPK